jgi:molybdopterin-guanine dinucleotide biosynthesis protein A
MIEHVVERLRPVVDEVVVVTSKDLSLPILRARIVEDRDAALGPLAGIRDGLEACGAEIAFVTSTDAPFLATQHVAGLLDSATPEAVCVPEAEGHLQVLSAVYPASAWKEADRLLSQGRRRPLELLERVGFEALQLEAPWPAGQAPWHGFNTPEEYLIAARNADPAACAEVELLGRAALGLESRHFRVPIGRLGEVLAALPLPKSLQLVENGKLGKPHLVSLGGRDLVRDLDVPIGPGERVSVIDALAGG